VICVLPCQETTPQVDEAWKGRTKHQGELPATLWTKVRKILHKNHHLSLTFNAMPNDDLTIDSFLESASSHSFRSSYSSYLQHSMWWKKHICSQIPWIFLSLWNGDGTSRYGFRAHYRIRRTSGQTRSCSGMDWYFRWFNSWGLITDNIRVWNPENMPSPAIKNNTDSAKADPTWSWAS